MPILILFVDSNEEKISRIYLRNLEFFFLDECQTSLENNELKPQELLETCF